MAPQVGLEPTTLRLTAGCSAIELLRSAVDNSAGALRLFILTKGLIRVKNLLQQRDLFRERFLVDHIRHFGHVSAVVFFQHVYEALGAAPGHTFVRIGGKPRNARTAGEMM